jgi:signal transduction histidine kinase
MTPDVAAHRVRERLPQTVRVRLSLLYAALFLAAGSLLLGLTYGLVASSLPDASTFTINQQAKAILACKSAKQAASQATKTTATGTAPPGKPVPVPVPASVEAVCARAYQTGASQAVRAQNAHTLHDLLLFSLLGLGVMTLASGALGWFMAGRVLRPVSAITATARRASERHLGERVGLTGPNDELKVLADTFDDMLARLDVAFASQQRFVADASHELRTPLAVMRTSIDVTMAKPQQSPEQIEAMTDKLRRSLAQAEGLVEALLTLAMSERRIQSPEFVDLATVAEDVLDEATPAVEAAGLRLHTDLDPAETAGDPVLLERLVTNLVDNAVRYNVDDGWVSVRSGTTGAGSFVEVGNSGPVIDADEIPLLLEPFRRSDGAARGGEGHGLGLAIVRSVAAAHSAELDVQARADGGLRIRVALPPPD